MDGAMSAQGEQERARALQASSASNSSTDTVHATGMPHEDLSVDSDETARPSEPSNAGNRRSTSAAVIDSTVAPHSSPAPRAREPTSSSQHSSGSYVHDDARVATHGPSESGWRPHRRVSSATSSTDVTGPQPAGPDIASLHAEEIGELSDTHAALRDFTSSRPAASGSARSSQPASRVPSGSVSQGPSSSFTKATLPVGQPGGSRSASASAQRPPQRERTKSKSRMTNRSRDASEDEDEPRAGSSMSPAPLMRRATSAAGVDDDEVEPVDRGEELVRKRMKDRARQKKVCHPLCQIV